MNDLLELMSRIAREAGAAILKVYGEDDFGQVAKPDDSPLTRADLAAHNIIVKELAAAIPEIPVLSEEADDIPWDERKSWESYFLVDPLDGTKEFISRNGEFTVNIALVEAGIPVMGVVHMPLQNLLYVGDQINGVARVTRDGKTSDITTRAFEPEEEVKVVASRRHGDAALEACMSVLTREFPQVETANLGSSLKLCLVAEGAADLYPRLAPTSEWDTAAAQAVVEAAGGAVVDMAMNRLRYNTRAETLNPFFYVIGDPDYDWSGLLSRVVLPAA